MQETVLLTGAAGFIGAYTARELLAKDKQVIGIDNLNNYYDVRLKEHRLEGLNQFAGFRFFKGDIEDVSFLTKIFSENKIRGVINLAARAGVRYSMDYPEIYMATNAMGTLNLLQQMKKHDIKKMVLASTSSLYAGQPMPFHENLPVNTPISPYAASKKAAEMMAYSYHYLYGMDISVVRYFTVYGPAGRPDMCVFRFIKWIDEGTPIELFGDGSQTRDFTFVEDIAKGTILASQKELGFEVINLGGGREPTSLKQIIQIIEKLLGKQAKINYKPFHKADVQDTHAEISKAKRILEWQPEVGIQAGIESCVKWYLENKKWVSSLKL